MEFKLSKYIILSDIFKEEDDDKKAYRILFSSRKKMGIKVHAGLVEILNRQLFDKLPDNIFSMLMHYEIIIPEKENEEHYLLDVRRLLINHDNDSSNGNQNLPHHDIKLTDFLKKENSKLLNLIDDGISYDFLEEDYNTSLILIQEDEIDFIPIDDSETYNNYDFYKDKIEKGSSGTFLLPIDQYKTLGKITKENLDLIIENFKLMLLLKYKINTKHA